MSRVVVIGAGLGGLGVALRLQGAGHDVVVVEQAPTPGGRAAQIVDGGFTWDTGPSLITMPWVLEETFAAGGLDLHREVTLRELDPFYDLFWADGTELRFRRDREAMQEELAKLSPRDAQRFPAYLDALAPIYEQGILGAGRREFSRLRDLAAFTPTMVRLGAALPLWTQTARFFKEPHVREAFSFHSLFIGGDPFRVPAIYGALVYLQFLDGVWYADGGVHALVEAMARPLDVRCGDGVARVETAAGAVSAVVTRGGERIPADVVVSNGDVLGGPEIVVDGGRSARATRRPLRPTMSCFLLYLGTDRQFPRLAHHTLLVGDGYKRFVRDVTRDGRLPSTSSTYLHVPNRTEPGMARPGGDSICVLLPVPNLRDGTDWSRESDRVRDWLVRDLESSFGLEGLGDSVVVEHRMTPADFRDRLGARDGNAFALEPTLHQSAALRPPNRDRRARGLYRVGGGTHPGAGIPGVLLGAEVTAGLVHEDVSGGVVAAPARRVGSGVAA